MSDAHQHEQTIFEQARHLPVEQRAPYLETACGSDTSLCRRIQARLASPQSTPPSPAAPGDDDETTGTTLSAGGVLNRAPEEAPGDAIGRYTLVEKLGEGGCGLVYLAEQMEPIKRHVALKITKLGMDTKQVVARFEAERQALAVMDHPNIASVIDGGATATGRPFFVMELVRGIRITDYCDQHKLSTRKRLDLFIQVCQAIAHAHQKGIIHRDIKPSNILVTQHDGKPVCKVIDFGIAKATQGSLTDKTVNTQVEQFIGTPAYMSPEQADMGGREIDARSDIYSLGVLLYELLTGHTPFEARGLLARGFDEMRRIIREIEPPRPSTRLGKQAKAELSNTARQHSTDAPELISVIRGDLDWIVMKCLEKDPSRRYATAADLTAEMQRFLANQPILARPPSHFYRFRKLVLRNRLVFATATIFFAALIAGLCVTTYFVFKEYDERERADRDSKSADSARKIAEQSRDEALAERKIAEEARKNTEASLLLSETNRLKAEASAQEALLSKQEAEAARKKAEDALQLAGQERKNAELANQKARESKSVAEAAQTEATSAVNKSEEAARNADTEAVLRQQADAARLRAEAAATAALADAGQLRGAISNILGSLATLPPAEALQAAAVFFKPDDEKQPWAVQLLRLRGEWRARRGDWKNSLADFSKVQELEPGDLESFSAIAPLLAQSGDWEAYNRQAARLLARASGTNPPAINPLLATDCLLAPLSGPDLAPAAALARRAVESGTNDTDSSREQLALGLAEYRQGRFAEAADQSVKALAASGENPGRRIQARAILALAQQQSKQADEARATLAQAAQIFETKLPKLESGDLGSEWRDWLIAKILLQEATALLQPQPPPKPAAATQ